MPDNINESTIVFPQKMEINSKYNYNTFIVECAKELFVNSVFENIYPDRDAPNEAELASTALRRAKLIAAELAMNGYLEN